MAVRLSENAPDSNVPAAPVTILRPAFDRRPAPRLFAAAVTTYDPGFARPARPKVESIS